MSENRVEKRRRAFVDAPRCVVIKGGMMKPSNLYEAIDAMGRATKAKESAVASEYADAMATGAYPLVLAGTAAAMLHRHMVKISERLTKEAPSMPTVLTYPQLTVVALCRGPRSASMRHAIGDPQIYVGSAQQPGGCGYEISWTPSGAPEELDTIALQIADWLTGGSSVLPGQPRQ